jgi:hypothetical protein
VKPDKSGDGLSGWCSIGDVWLRRGQMLAALSVVLNENAKVKLPKPQLFQRRTDLTTRMRRFMDLDDTK